MPEKKIKAKQGVADERWQQRGARRVTATTKRSADIGWETEFSGPRRDGKQNPDTLKQSSLLQQIVKVILKVNWKQTIPYLLYLKVKGMFTLVPVAEEESQMSKAPFQIKSDKVGQSETDTLVNRNADLSGNTGKPVFHPLILIIFLLIFVLGLGAGHLIPAKITFPWQNPPGPVTSSNKYVAFLDEVYDTIQKNYWNKLTDTQLIQLYVLGTAKLTNQPAAQNVKTPGDLNNVLKNAVNSFPDDNKKEAFTATLADLVLANLEPFGRSRLYSQQDTTSLQNNVANINPEVNRYQELGLSKNASENQISQAFQKEQAKLAPKAESSPAAKQQLDEITQAYNTLSDADARKIYDTSGVEPTMSYKLIGSNILYIHQTKFSPTTLDELQRITQKFDQGNSLHTLIFDMRDNVGGAIDLLPYILGPFIGPDQYAYQFYHQGDKQDFKTLTSWMPSLVRYKQVVVLINGGTQSSAEVMAAVLKKYNVGILVGTKTAGWGTVERVFPLTHQIDPSQKFSAFLVHSLTLRDDGQPIQGNGVQPSIDTSKPDWEQQLYTYYNNQELVNAVKNILSQ